jgi:hypothetical protein
MSERQESGKTFYVYRAFDGDGRLLYAGLTVDLVARFKQHLSQSAWIWDVESITADAYLARPEAVNAERDTILSERPKWNIQHADDPAATQLELRILEETQSSRKSEQFMAWLDLVKRINALTEPIQEATEQGAS